MYQKSREIAENASFQAFVNSYIREMGSVKWYSAEEVHGCAAEKQYLEIPLPFQQTALLIGVSYRSIVGRHTLAAVYRKSGEDWQKTEPLQAMLWLCQELHLHAGSCSHYDELLYRLLDSCQTMTKIVEYDLQTEREQRPEKMPFIEAEQSLRFGHWLHPTPKSRQGMTGWQQELYSPELGGQFPLQYFAVSPEWVEHGSALEEEAPDLVKNELMFEDQQEDDIVIPMHPLQAQWLLQQEWVQQAIREGRIRDLGTMGPVYAATSSIRTVFNEASRFMLKFSIPVKVTNSLRVNKYHELFAGVVMSRLVKKMSHSLRYPVFSLMEDPAFMTVRHPSAKESGFEVILRENTVGRGEGIMPVATLVQDPLPGNESCLALLVKSQQRPEQSLAEAGIDWFKAYWNVAIDPMITLYDEYGMALEAHQQNSVIDVSTGRPSHFYFRDNQGYYLARSYRKMLTVMEPSLLSQEELFYPEAVIEERFTYYLLQNHLFSIIHRFGADGITDEQVLLDLVWEMLTRKKEQMAGAAKRWIEYVLTEETLPCKANLLTRLQDMDELEVANEKAVYVTCENPFAGRDSHAKRTGRTTRMQTAY